MAFNDGWEGFFSLDNSADSVVELTSYIVSLEFNRETDVNEVTAWGNAGNRSYRAGLNNPGTISITFRRDPAVDAVFRTPRTPAVGRDFVYGPDGNANGAARVTGKAFITSYSTSSDFESVQECSAELQVTGVITDDAFP